MSVHGGTTQLFLKVASMRCRFVSYFFLFTFSFLLWTPR